MRDASKLLLEREPANGHQYCRCAKKNPLLKGVITILTALKSAHNTQDIAEKALARQASVVEVLLASMAAGNCMYFVQLQWQPETRNYQAVQQVALQR